MSNVRCTCRSDAACQFCDDRAEAYAEERTLGEPMSDRDWDRLEHGPMWHHAPGSATRED
jgi:hypothetical protein